MVSMLNTLMNRLLPWTKEWRNHPIWKISGPLLVFSATTLVLPQQPSMSLSLLSWLGLLLVWKRETRGILETGCLFTLYFSIQFSFHQNGLIFWHLGYAISYLYALFICTLHMSEINRLHQDTQIRRENVEKKYQSEKTQLLQEEKRQYQQLQKEMIICQKEQEVLVKKQQHAEQLIKAIQVEENHHQKQGERLRKKSLKESRTLSETRWILAHMIDQIKETQQAVHRQIKQHITAKENQETKHQKLLKDLMARKERLNDQSKEQQNTDSCKREQKKIQKEIFILKTEIQRNNTSISS